MNDITEKDLQYLRNEVEPREIEFRVFDKDLKKMIYPKPLKIFQVTSTGISDLILGNFYIGNITDNYKIRNINDMKKAKERYILMQKTEFKDKNGIEMYEGDLINWEHYSREYHCEKCGYSKGGDVKHVILWTVRGWSHHAIYEDTYPFDDEKDLHDIVIIGNIYEGEKDEK